MSMCRKPHSVRPCQRVVVLGVCLWALAASAHAVAQDPAADAYEPNENAQMATSMEPAKRYVATISGPADSDWFTIQPETTSWRDVFGTGRDINVSAQRLHEGCAGRSLRVTLFTANGRIVTSAAVYPGREASVVSIDGEHEPEARYDLKVDTALDPECAQPVPYAITAQPFVPVPHSAPSPGSAGAPRWYNSTSCAVYTKKVRKLKKDIHQAKGSHIKKLRQDLKRDTIKRDKACHGK